MPSRPPVGTKGIGGSGKYEPFLVITMAILIGAIMVAMLMGIAQR